MKLICTDLDGTLLSPDGTISEINLQALYAARKQGIGLAITSGRRFDSIQSILQDNRLTGFKASLNGAYVLSKEDKLVADFPMEMADVLKLYDLGRQIGANVFFNNAQQTFFVHGKDEFSIPEFAKNRDRVGVIQTKDEINQLVADQGPIYKMSFNSHEHEKLQAAYQLIETKMPAVTEVWSDTDYVEMNAWHVSKLMAIKQIAATLKIEIADVVAFGDYENDIAMLRGVGLGVAMSNGLPEVKRVANRVVDNQDYSGVGRVVDELLSTT